MRKWSLLVLILPILAGCSCDESLANAAGKVTATPAALDFGGVHVGAEATQDVEFRNQGATPVTLRVADMPAGFQMRPATLKLGPGAAAKWTFVFTPEVVGEAGGDARFELTGASHRELIVPVKGVGFSRDVLVEDLDFGLVPVGETKTMPFPIRSESEGHLSVQVTLSGSEAGSFSLESNVVEVGPGALRGVDITFAPQLRGARSAQVEVKTCSDCPAQLVRVRGHGAVSELQTNPRVLDFLQVVPGRSKTIALEISNVGDLPILLDSGSLLPDGSIDFSADFAMLPVELAGGEKIDVDVRYHPPANAVAGEQINAIRFFGADGGPLLEVPMRGEPGGPDLVVTPEQIDFGHQPVGLPITRTVTIRNIGEPRDVYVISASLTGAQLIDFRVDPLGSLPANVGTEQVSFQVVYKATAAGASNAELLFRTDDDDREYIRVPLGGTARVTEPCDVTVIPPLLRFGLVPSTGEFVRSVEVRNNGADDCMIWDVRFETGSSPYFATAGTPEETTVIPPGGSLPLAVRFTPAGVADVFQEGELTFGHSTPETPRHLVDVTAYPSRYDLLATPNPVDLGEWPMEFRNIANLNVKNRSAFGVNVIGASRTTETSEEFGIAPALGVPGQVAADDTGIFHVSYAAAEAGTDEGQVEIYIAEAPEPLLVDVKGKGTDEACGVLCAAPSAFCPGPQTTNVNNLLNLVGAGSDPAGDPITCTWSVLSRPTGSSAAPQTPAQCATGFVPDLVGDYVLQLTVRDPMGNTGSCATPVHANPYGGLWVEMFWSPAGDIDLHVLHPLAGPATQSSSWTNSQYACHYANCKIINTTPLEWDSLTLNDNPSLDVDDISGTGPENIRVHQPSSSHPYIVGFKNFSNGNLPVSVTYNVYCGGQRVHGQVYQAPSPGTFVHVGDVTHNSAGCSFVPGTGVVP